MCIGEGRKGFYKSAPREKTQQRRTLLLSRGVGKPSLALLGVDVLVDKLSGAAARLHATPAIGQGPGLLLLLLLGQLGLALGEGLLVAPLNLRGIGNGRLGALYVWGRGGRQREQTTGEMRGELKFSWHNKRVEER
jgi:hypothetical protein